MAKEEKDTPGEGHNQAPEPDFAKAAKIYTDDIAPLLEDSAEIRGDASAAWKRIKDDCRVNKKAAKDVAALAKSSPEKQSDYLRSFVGMCDALGVGIRLDLVDMAEGNTQGFTIPVKEAPPADDEA